MSFAAPLLLLFLLPWLTLVLWLLSGQRHRVAVPFLELWNGPVTEPKVRRTIQPPPIALACALAAMLLAIIGAAAPSLRAGSAKTGVTLIVDRGVTMAVQTRRAQLYNSLPSIRDRDVIVVPPWGGISADGSNWKDAPPSAIATGDLLENAVAHALSNTNGSVVVVSDQHLDRTDPRIIQIAPAGVPQNVDITRVAASISPAPQVMIRLRNQSNLGSCQLAVSSAGQHVTRTIALPAREAESNVFVDLPTVGDTIQATISAPDDLAADNTAWLVRQRLWPRVEARSELPAELRRMSEVYQAHRPASEDSMRVAIVENLSELAANEPAVFVRGSEGSPKPPTSGAAVEVGDHPIVAGIDWPQIAKDALVADSPGAGWMTLVHCGSQVLVAVREQPARQAWVGFTSPNFPKTKDFVIFWTNIFDWVGHGGDEFVSEPMQSVGGEWKLQTDPSAGGFDPSPGVYHRSDGTLRALNAVDVHFDQPPQTDWQRQLTALSGSSAAGVDLAPGVLIAALLLLLGSAMLWKGRHS